MAQSNGRNFQESMAVREIGDNEYETLHPPERMGNSANIAYGGCAMTTAAKAAVKSVLEGYQLYSMLGHFLGPALTDRPLRASVRVIRQTRTFATRQVEVSQKQDDGTLRPCLLALADFQTKEPDSFMEYSVQPSKKFSRHEDLEPTAVQLDRAVEEGKFPRKIVDLNRKMFGLQARFYDMKLCPEGLVWQTLYGMQKHLPTTQDHLPLTERSTGDWLRTRESLQERSDNIASVAFFIDGALSFVPLTFSHMFLDDAGACSSLDFALRIFSNDIDMSKWHFREIQTKVGAEGRTYSESRVWDEHGRLVANMTQQSILRPKKTKDQGKL